MSAEWNMPGLSELVQMCIRHVAEVDDAYDVTINTDRLYAALVHAHDEVSVTVYIPERDEYVSLNSRKLPFLDAWYLVYTDDDTFRWVTLADVGGDKESYMPPVSLDSTSARDGSWRDELPQHDQIIDIDNAAITHRPDLWGHRGFARELDARYTYQHGTSMMRPFQDMSHDVPVHAADQAPANTYQPQIHADGCDRCVSYYIPDITATPSKISIAVRLAQVGVKPHNLLVDLTNYVMFDIGQPMHAFDADRLAEARLGVRYAGDGESLAALDGTKLTLSDRDMVVTSADQLLSVAGVIGGSGTGVRDDTQAVVLEAAHFDPIAIRTTSARIKRRTESSMRFEKNVDPHATDRAVQRYCALLAQCGAPYDGHAAAYADGQLPERRTISVTHQFIMQRTGLDGMMSSDDIVHIMSLLGCDVSYADGTYHMTVPTYRLSDLTRAEDIVEEIARIYGYDHIPLEVPHRPMYPRDVQPSQRVHTIKKHCAYALSMREMTTYAFFDEQWLNTLQWAPDDAVLIANPVSENMYRLVTTLMPNMLYAVANNVHTHRQLRVFEWGATWKQVSRDDSQVQEDETCAALVYNQQRHYDFYAFKSDIHSIFTMIHMPVAWRNIDDHTMAPAWCYADETAHLLYEKGGTWYHLGYAGRVNSDWMARIADGYAYGCELDGYALRHYHADNPVFAGLSKYQSTWFDVSLGVPEDITVAQLENCARHADERIHDVYLVDLYEQPTHEYARSVTLRITAGHMHKTLTSDEIEAIREHVHAEIRQYNVTIR